MKIQLSHKFKDIINLENLLAAWQEFLRGKSNRQDVQKLSVNLMDNIFSLHSDLLYHDYKHGGYEAFKINDPKPRDIHEDSVRDRLLHHAVYRILYPFFAKTFIADSYSCQINKGTHRALDRFRQFAYQASKNNTRACYVLKGDIRKFFASIDQDVILNILREYIPDKNIIWLLEEIIFSFSSGKKGIGLPLGNLTSQLFVNIYMNRFDQFVKHGLIKEADFMLCHSCAGGNPGFSRPSWIPACAGMIRVTLTHPVRKGVVSLPRSRDLQPSQGGNFYIRYADDFVIFSENKKWLQDIIPVIANFLSVELRLELHPDKLFIKTIASGVDFLGMINFPDHRILRTKTKRRMLKRISAGREKLKNDLISEEYFKSSFNSYLCLLSHGNSCKVRKKLLNIY
jgi:hypothetical protein